MKRNILTIRTIALFMIGSIAISGCGGSVQETEKQQHMDDEMHGDMGTEGETHDHQEMKEVSSEISITQCPKWKKGEHQHAAYVCPMWDEEGESDVAGECSKCGMSLVKFENVKEEHDMQKDGSNQHDMKSQEN